jgi:hypothetical protein
VEPKLTQDFDVNEASRGEVKAATRWMPKWAKRAAAKRGMQLAGRAGMRWVTTTMGALAICVASSGCISQAVMNSGDPKALVLLPLTLPLDLGLAALTGGANLRNVSMSGPTPAYNGMRDWVDPNDWVADCAGPILCPEGAQHRCTGTPGACSCDCVWVAQESCPAEWASREPPLVAAHASGSAAHCN